MIKLNILDEIREGSLFLIIHVYDRLLTAASSLLLLTKNRVAEKISLQKRTQVSLRASLPAMPKKEHVIWIHAASLGEVRVSVRLLQVYEKKKPDQKFILTALSETGFTYLKQQKLPHVLWIGFFPLDTMGSIHSILNTFSVQRVWLVETEIWPCMLWMCMKQRIPCSVINGRIEQKSYVWFKRMSFFFRPLLQQLNPVLSQDTLYTKRFIDLGVPRAHVFTIGNIKSYITIVSPDKEQRLAKRKELNCNSRHTVITVGCIHPGEAEIVADAIQRCRSSGHDWKWIVVPRHIEKTATIAHEMKISPLVLEKPATNQKWDVCIIRSFGILEHVYQISNAVVLGGTFIPVGGHNLWEAVHYSCPVVFGPFFHTQQASYEKVMAAHIGFCVSDAAQLSDTLCAITSTEKQAFTRAIGKFKTELGKIQSDLEEVIP